MVPLGAQTILQETFVTSYPENQATTICMASSNSTTSISNTEYAVLSGQFGFKVATSDQVSLFDFSTQSLRWTVYVGEPVLDYLLWNDSVIVVGTNQIFSLNTQNGSLNWTYRDGDRQDSASNFRSSRLYFDNGFPSDTIEVFRICLDENKEQLIVWDLGRKSLLSLKPDGTITRRSSLDFFPEAKNDTAAILFSQLVRLNSSFVLSYQENLVQVDMQGALLAKHKGKEYAKLQRIHGSQDDTESLILLYKKQQPEILSADLKLLKALPVKSSPNDVITSAQQFGDYLLLGEPSIFYCFDKNYKLLWTYKNDKKVRFMLFSSPAFFESRPISIPAQEGEIWARSDNRLVQIDLATGTKTKEFMFTPDTHEGAMLNSLRQTSMPLFLLGDNEIGLVASRRSTSRGTGMFAKENFQYSDYFYRIRLD
jgi:hypothetical protein